MPAFRGCVRVLGQAIGSLPFNVYEEDPNTGVRTKAVEHPAYPIIHDTPNSFMTSMELRQAMMLDYCASGNGYAEIIRNKTASRLLAINPLPAARTYPKVENGSLYYYYTDMNGAKRQIAPESVIHVKNPLSDGVCGMPHVPSMLLQRALDTQLYGASFMRNQGRPSGVLSSEQTAPADTKASERMREEWDKVFANPSNAGKTAVLWRGLKYQSVSANPEEAQYNETIQQLNAEFAGLFGVPLNLIDQTDKTATYASAEQFDIQFVKHVARPLAVMFEQAFNKKIFAREPNTFCELDLDGLLRGDSQATATVFASYSQNGIMKRDELRKKLNLPSAPGGDVLTVQSNMIPLDMLGKVPAAPTNQPTGGNQ